MLSVEIGKKIEALRKEKKLSIQEIISQSDVSQQTYYNIIGNKTSISIDVLERFANALKVEVSYFFTNIPPSKLSNEDKIYIIDKSKDLKDVNPNHIIDEAEKFFNNDKEQILLRFIVDAKNKIIDEKKDKLFWIFYNLVFSNKDITNKFIEFVCSLEIIKIGEKEYVITDKASYDKKYRIPNKETAEKRFELLISSIENETPSYLVEIEEFIQFINTELYLFKVIETNTGSKIEKVK